VGAGLPAPPGPAAVDGGVGGANLDLARLQQPATRTTRRESVGRRAGDSACARHADPCAFRRSWDASARSPACEPVPVLSGSSGLRMLSKSRMLLSAYIHDDVPGHDESLEQQRQKGHAEIPRSRLSQGVHYDALRFGRPAFWPLTRAACCVRWLFACPPRRPTQAAPLS
jgi:hypothetical protein